MEKARRKKKSSEKKTSVYQCKHFEFDDDDPAGCGESWCWCHSPKSGKNVCDGRYIYSQKFCPFYEKGPFRGIWTIGEAELEEAEQFKQKYAAMKDMEEDKMSNGVKRNFENYKTRHEAYLAFKALKKHPYWFVNDKIPAYIAVDFHEWLWLPVTDDPAYPLKWKREYLGVGCLGDGEV